MKLRELGVWDKVVDKVGGEKLRLMQFEREISRLQKSGNVTGAARLYEEAEWYPEAINLYVEAEEYALAGALHEQLEQWERAADMYFKGEDWKRAARMLIKVGKHAAAAKHYEDHGQKIDAAKLYFDAGQYDKAAELYSNVSYFPQAAKCYEKLGEYIKAAENYEEHWSATTSVGGGGLIAAPSEREAKVALHAGQLYEKGGAPERAAELYKRAGLARPAAELAAKEGRYLDAAEMLLREEKLEAAAEMFHKGGETRRAALLLGEVAFHQGDSQTAADRFLEGGDNLRAAELYETIGDLNAAAKCYQQSDAPIQAAGVYLRAGEKGQAAEMYERGQDFAQAAKLYEEVKNLAKASELYEQSGQFFEAGKLAQQRGDDDRAIQLLQQIDGNHENYEAATLILSRLFLAKNMPGLAVDKIKRLIGNQQIGSNTLEHFYCLGLAYEQLDKPTEAIDTFRKVMTERYGYEDVEQRIARLSSAGAPAAQPVSSPAPVVQPAPVSSPPAAPVVAPPPTVQAQAVAAAPPAAASPIQLGEVLGQGLLGTSYKGIDSRNQSPVTVKLLREDLIRDQNVVQQFLAEAKVARGFDHPSIVRLLGLIEIQGSKAAVTEFVEGFSLATFLERNKRLTIKQAVDLLHTLSMAMAYAHERKLLHRDLKLSNILVGAGGKLKLTGFGLGALRLAQLGKADGYPAPEFLNGSGIGPRSDIYSLGAVIFHALTELNPVSANGASPPLRQLLPEAPELLEQILARCLAHDPAQRFASAAELNTLLKGVQV
jgi:tetratricopeptide (TPR) repeat protein